MKTEKFEGLVYLRNGWVKSSLCLGLLLGAIVIPVVSILVLYSIVLSSA